MGTEKQQTDQFSKEAVNDLELLLQTDTKLDLDPAFAILSTRENPGRVVVALSGDFIGVGDESHGRELLHVFVAALCAKATLPDEVVFYHRGVLLLAPGHALHDTLTCLSSHDVQMKAASESLDYYKIEPTIPQVQSVPMCEITRDILRADKVLRP